MLSLSIVELWFGEMSRATTKKSQVQAIISNLYDKQNQEQENALVLLLQVFAENLAQADARHSALIKIAETLSEFLDTNN